MALLASQSTATDARKSFVSLGFATRALWMVISAISTTDSASPHW
jgi:hypothetical protein